MIITNTTVSNKELVEAGIISTLFKSIGKLLDKISTWEPGDEPIKEGSTAAEALKGVIEFLPNPDDKYTEDQAEKGNYPYRMIVDVIKDDDRYRYFKIALKPTGSPDSDAVVKDNLKVELPQVVDNTTVNDEVAAQEEFEKAIEELLQSQALALIKSFDPKVTSIKDTQIVASSIKVKLEKITANSEPEVKLTRITSDYDFDTTLKALTDVISDNSFVDSMPEGCTSYEIYCDPEHYDVDLIDGENFQVDTCDSIRGILQATYCLWSTCKFLSWNGTGPYSAYLSQTCDMYAYEADELINYLSKLCWMKCKVAPHPADFFKEDNPCLQFVSDMSDSLKTLKNAMDCVINAIDLVVCNFDKDEQQAFYQYLGRWKQYRDYTLAKMEE